MLGMKNHFDISGSMEIRKVDIAGVACICKREAGSGAGGQHSVSRRRRVVGFQCKKIYSNDLENGVKVA